MKPESPARMRNSLEAKFRSAAIAGRLDAGQICRRFIFQRVLRRLAMDGGWVLKGGFLLETRIPAGARATKDLDFATASAESSDELMDRLRDALEIDEDGDFLVFSIQKLKSNRRDRRGLASWSASIDVQLDSRAFDRIKLDIAERLGEVDGGTELFVVPPVVPVAGLDGVSVQAVDVCQHAAEKFHALCLEFDDGRPNTRVKDLVDIVLLYEAGLIPHERLTSRIVWVFGQRDQAAPPAELPAIPAAWDADYQALTLDLDIAIRTAGEAHILAQQIFRDAVVGVSKAPIERSN